MGLVALKRSVIIPYGFEALNINCTSRGDREFN
jgi:hypothetical protein